MSNHEITNATESKVTAMPEYTEIQKAAADEIDRRAMPKATRPQFKHHPVLADLMFKASGATLRELAGPLAEKVEDQVAPKAKAEKSPKGKSSKPVAVERVHPMKGKSRYGLSPEQQAQQRAIYEATGGGAEYHEQCKTAGIPTRKNGLLTK